MKGLFFTNCYLSWCKYYYMKKQIQTTLVCTICHETKPIELFPLADYQSRKRPKPPRPENWNLRRKQCRKCRVARQKARLIEKHGIEGTQRYHKLDYWKRRYGLSNEMVKLM